MKKIQYIVLSSILWTMGTVKAQSDSLEHHINVKREKFRLYNV